MTTILQPTMRNRETHPCKFCKVLAPVIVCFQTKCEIVTCCSGRCANLWLQKNMGVTRPFFDNNGKAIDHKQPAPQQRPVEIATR